MIDQDPDQKKIEKEAIVIFEDNISRCLECGTPLYPQAMVKRLESKIFTTKENTWPFHLCPSCRMKTQFNPPPSPSPSRGEGEAEGNKNIF
jgi:uncharacterized protein with PIN domain